MTYIKDNIFWLIGGAIIVVVFLLPIISFDYREYVSDLIRAYPYLAPIIIAIFRFLGVVLAPLPGAPVAFASMALWPWYEAWAYNFIGAELGMIAAFLIARKFREPVVARFAPLEKIHHWQDKISQRKQFWSFVGLRVVSLFAFDFVSYAAGLTKLSFRNFFLATLLVDIPIGFLFFYLGGLAIKYSIFLYGTFAAIFMINLFIFGYLRGNLKLLR